MRAIVRRSGGLRVIQVLAVLLVGLVLAALRRQLVVDRAQHRRRSGRHARPRL